MARARGEGKTPGRNIRVEPDLWEASKAVAAERGSSVNAEIVAFLERLTKKAAKARTDVAA